MRVAILSDIHGNIYALEAVVKSLKSKSVDATVFLGDIAYAGVYPRECLSLLMSLDGVITIKGNADSRFDKEEQPKKDDKPTVQEDIHNWVSAQLSSNEKEIIRGFSPNHTLIDDGVKAGFYHGSPLSNTDRIYDDDPASEIAAKFRDTGCILAAVGHTHERMHLYLDALEVINPGALSMSCDRDTRAGYGIIQPGNPIGYEQINISYSIESYIEDIKKSTMPHKESIVHRVGSGEPNKSVFRWK